MRYVLVSACRNEADYIDGLVECIAAQTVPPASWVIVDDGSTDDTYAIARRATAQLPYADVVKMQGGRPRSFTSQVFAAQHGCELLREVDYEYVGFLDADIRFDRDYYERMLEQLSRDPQLGICGGALWDREGDRLTYVRAGSEDYHVPGGIQLYRRQCYEQIGGFIPIQGGGQDTIANFTALMRGWKVRTFADTRVMHLRPAGVATSRALKRALVEGRKHYLLGYHPLFYLLHCIRRSLRRPAALIGQLAGFAVATMKRDERPVSNDFVAFVRRHQFRRVREALSHATNS